MDQATRNKLARYLTDVQSLPNESAKTHRFASLVSEMFPGSNAPTELAAGVEKLVRIDASTGSGRRYIDAFYGNAVIEFENSLRATEDEAKRQLREQVAGLRRAGDDRPLLCIASDGIVWKSFRAVADVSQPAPGDIELVALRELTLSERTLNDFWMWLTSLLFREGRTDPTAERFRVDFGGGSLAFSEAMDALRSAWDSARAEPEVQLALDTWTRYLTVTYGSLSGRSGSRPELEELFLKHTYLASLARLLIWASLSGGRATSPLREIAGDVLSGDYFRAQGIENLVEDDFFQWVRRTEAEPILAPVWERTLAQLQTYDLARLDQDVLKGVYQELVDPVDRHDLGEYYTPEWLCERMVAELLPTTGFVSVIDPACGSGSFLRAAIAHMLRSNPKGGRAMRLRRVLDSAVGIDIHPLAVTIARATYVLALGQLVKATKRPIQIPIYLADSLFLPAEVTQHTLGEAPGYEIRFGGRTVRIAESLVCSPELFDPAIAAGSRVAAEHARTGRETEATLRAYVKQAVPDLARRGDFESVLAGLWSFVEQLADLIRAKRNSIWAFIVRNSYRPAMLRDRFDFVIGNPPWLSYRYIADPEYQAEVKKRAVNDYGIAPKSQKLVTQMELATVFLVHTLKAFGREGARQGFVMPRSILTADQHAKLRERKYVAPLTVDRYWDLWNVRPLFNVPSCVVFSTRELPPHSGSSYELPAVEWSGRLPNRDVSWAEAESSLEAEERKARLIFLGNRSALSTVKGQTKPSRGSRYRKRFRQGATIVPRNFYFVDVADLSGRVDPATLYWAETDAHQARRAKAPYRDVRMRGHVEGRFIYLTALSENVLPFALVDPKLVVLPVTEDRGTLSMLSARELKDEGYREMAAWMEEAERIWTEKRGSKAARQSVYERVDYHSELTVQNLEDQHLVLYNASGTDLSAARVDRKTLPVSFIIDHKTYWAECSTVDEAAYLAAFLNSEAVNEAIKPFQSTGLMGERDIHKKVLDLPIPLFRPNDARHQRLAELGKRAASEGEAFLADADLPRSLARRRAMVREAIAGTRAEIDMAVGKLLS